MDAKGGPGSFLRVVSLESGMWGGRVSLPGRSLPLVFVEGGLYQKGAAEGGSEGGREEGREGGG